MIRQITFVLFLFLALPCSSAVADSTVLHQVLQRVDQETSAAPPPVVIFDIEGTLLDTRGRVQKILHDYATAELTSVRPKAAERILAIKKEGVRGQLTETLAAAGVTEPAIINNAHSFWAERYYSNDYLDFDTPTVGAAGFVRSLYARGARIVYLSARDSERQLVGTVQSLQQHGFPIGVHRTELIMRPTPQTSIHRFKRETNVYLHKGGTVIAAFDNDPRNINYYSKAFSKALCVLHGPPPSLQAPKLHKGIYRVTDFRNGSSSPRSNEVASIGRSPKKG